MALNKKKISADAAQAIINQGKNIVGKVSGVLGNMTKVPSASGNTASGAAPTADYGALADKYMKDYENSRFSYDFNTDPVYQAAKQAYMNQGSLAAKNVAAQAAKLTGGYGNSYGTVAAQQQFNQALENVNNIIPELQNAAYSRYQNDLAKKQSLANWYLQNSRYKKEDERYADETAYNRERDRISDARYADELAYSRSRDRISDERYADETAYNRKQTEIGNALEKAKIAASIGDYSFYKALGFNVSNAEQAALLDNAYSYAQKTGDFSKFAALGLDPAAVKANLTAATSSGSGSSGRTGGSSGSSGRSRGSSGKSSSMTMSQYNTLRNYCKKASNDTELKKLLDGYLDNGYINSDMYDELWSDYAEKPNAGKEFSSASSADAVYKMLAKIYVPAKTADQRNTFLKNKVEKYVEEGAITEEEALEVLDRLGVSYVLR